VSTDANDYPSGVRLPPRAPIISRIRRGPYLLMRQKTPIRGRVIK
jgi:hypothetical protein